MIQIQFLRIILILESFKTFLRAWNVCNLFFLTKIVFIYHIDIILYAIHMYLWYINFKILNK